MRGRRALENLLGHALLLLPAVAPASCRREARDPALDRLGETADPDEVDRIYGKISKVFLTDPPMVRLIPLSRDWFVHRRIRGLSTPYHAAPNTYMEDLWIEK